MDSVGLIQMTSGPSPSENLRFLAQEIIKCKAHGAKWVICPENALVFGSKQDYHQHAEPLGDGPLQTQVCDLAKQHRMWIVIGSMPSAGARTTRPITTSERVAFCRCGRSVVPSSTSIVPLSLSF